MTLELKTNSSVLIRVVSVAALCLACVGGGVACKEKAPSTTETAEEEAGFSRPVDEGTPAEQNALMKRLRESSRAAPIALAMYGSDRVFSTAELEDYLLFDPPPGITSPEVAYYLDYGAFREVVSVVLANYLLADFVEMSNAPEALMEKIADAQEKALLAMLSRDEVLQPIVSLTREDVHDDMLRNLNRYTIPMETMCNQLFFSGHREHIVAEGETLESLAESISGDVKWAVAIRDATTGRGLWVAPEDRKRRPVKPLEIGQRLWIPSPEERKQARARATEAMDAITKGESLESVGKRMGFSEQDLLPFGPLPQGPTPILPAIHAAISDPHTDVGQTTGVIETCHGFHIISIAHRVEPGVRDLESVFQEKFGQHEAAQAAMQHDGYLSRLVSERLEFDDAALMNDNAAPDDVICWSGDWKVALAELKKYLKEPPKYMRRDVEYRKREIRKLPYIQGYLGLERARERSLDKTIEYERQAEALRAYHLSQFYVQYEALRRYEETDEVLRAYYDEHIKDYTSAPSYRMWEIAMKPRVESPEELAATARQLETAKQSIKTFGDFKAQARLLHYDSLARLRDGERRGETRANYRGAALAKKLANATVGQVAGPFEAQGLHLLVWIESVTPPVVKPYEEVKNLVQARCNRERQATLQRAIRAEALEAVGFKMLVNLK